MAAYSQKNLSKTVDVINVGPYEVSAGTPTASTTGILVGNALQYGLKDPGGYTVNAVMKITGATAIADCKVRALVNGSLAKEITYTTDGVKSDFSFNAVDDAIITLEISTTAAGAEIVKVDPLRLVILAGATEKNCVC